MNKTVAFDFQPGGWGFEGDCFGFEGGEGVGDGQLEVGSVGVSCGDEGDGDFMDEEVDEGFLIGLVLDVSGFEGGEPVDDVGFVDVEDFARLLFELGFQDTFFVFEVGDAFDEDFG